jgi:hypothetical protein
MATAGDFFGEDWRGNKKAAQRGRLKKIPLLLIRVVVLTEAGVFGGFFL